MCIGGCKWNIWGWWSWFHEIPSLPTVIKIPETVEGLWCEGEVHVGYKEAVFQPSSALCHVTEVHLILKIGSKSMTTTSHWRAGSTSDLLCSTLFVLSFWNRPWDCLVVERTAPNHSWRNPVERTMSVIKLGLQCVGTNATQGQLRVRKECQQPECSVWSHKVMKSAPSTLWIAKQVETGTLFSIQRY